MTFCINSIGKLKAFRAKQKKYDQKYKQRAWDEAKQYPPLHDAMKRQRRLNVQKSRLKGI